MTFCADTTETDAAIDAVSGWPESDRSRAKTFARALVSRGVTSVYVHGWCGRTVPHLRYHSDTVSAKYEIGRDGVDRVFVCTSFDNGHSGTMQVPARAYGLIAAMLLART